VRENPCVAYDEDLAERIRELLAADPDVTESTPPQRTRWSPDPA
jgi:hypothetical protein